MLRNVLIKQDSEHMGSSGDSANRCKSYAYKYQRLKKRHVETKFREHASGRPQVDFYILLDVIILVMHSGPAWLYPRNVCEAFLMCEDYPHVFGSCRDCMFRKAYSALYHLQHWK